MLTTSTFEDLFATWLKDDSLAKNTPLISLIRGTIHPEDYLSSLSISTDLTPAERIESLEVLLSICLAAPSHQDTISNYLEILSNYPINDTWQIHTLLIALNTYFIRGTLPPYTLKQFPSGFIPIHSEELFISHQLPLTPFYEKCGLYSLLLGFFTSDPHNLEQGLKLAEWQSHLLDTSYSPPYTLFCPESSYNKALTLKANIGLFSCAYLASKNKFYQDIYLKQLEMLQEQKTFHPPILEALIYQYLLEKKHPSLNLVPQTTSQKKSPFMDTSLSLTSIHQPKQDILITFNGFNSGIGSIRSKTVNIATFGPQKAPLDNTQTFGIFNAYFPSFEDHPMIKNDLSSDSFSVSGRITFMPKIVDGLPPSLLNKVNNPPDTWAKLSITSSHEGIQINCTPISSETNSAIYMSFFIDAEACIIDNKTLYRNSLETLKVNTQEVLFFVSDTAKEGLSIRSKEMAYFHLIPLSGTKYFWGASFLLACELQVSKSFTWTIQTQYKS